MFFGVTGAGPLLRDKYGHSQHGQLYAAAMAWPHYWVVLVGAFCSTLGVALQCLTSECASTGPDRPMLLPGYAPFHAPNLVYYSPVANRIYLHACDS